jgi:hypothetical protein
MQGLKVQFLKLKHTFLLFIDFNGIQNCDIFSMAPSVIIGNIKNVLCHCHRHKIIHRPLIWRGLPDLFWLSSYVTSRCLAAAPQSGEKQNVYCTVYYITLNSNCEPQRASRNLKKIVEDRGQK